MKIVLEDRIRVIDFPGEGPWSEAEFLDFCMANKDLNLERDKDGNVLIMSPVNIKGANFELRAGAALEVWNQQTGLGYAFGSQAGFTLPNGAIRSPDVSWVLKERIDKLPPQELEKFAHICPDFVVEIRSKTDRIQPLHEKMQEYLENGARLGFLIDPYERNAWIYRPDRNAEMVTDFESALSGEPVLPGFALPLDIFRL